MSGITTPPPDVPMHFLSIRKTPLAAAVVAAVSLLAAGFITVKPNRLLDGQGVLLSQAHPAAAQAAGLLLLLMLLASLFRMSVIIRQAVLGLLPVLLIPTLPYLAGRHAASVFHSAGPVARVSMGPALWISIFCLAAMAVDSFRTWSGRQRTIWICLGLSSILMVLVVAGGYLDDISIMREFANRRSRFARELVTHLALAWSAVSLATVIGVPLGLAARRYRKFRAGAFLWLNTLQTIPSLALFGILIPVLGALTARLPILERAGIRGIGVAPALIALVAYSLLPVARNTYAGFTAVDAAVVEAGRGMGMTSLQLLLRVELPIASPVLLNGIRVAAVQATGLTAVAALIGAGGFGVFIFQGLGQAATDLILLGAIPTIMVALAADGAMSGLIAMVRPKGLQ